MRLYLLQHGEAEPAERDPERGLSARGRVDVEHLTAFARRLGLQVRRIVHSGKTRALQTAAQLAHAVLAEGEMDTSGLLEPQADPAPFAALVRGWDEDSMVVGHLPFLAGLAAELLGDGTSPRLAFRPGSLACLERDAQGHWSLAWFVGPELLPG